MSDTSFDVVIIGAGIAGASLAYALAPRLRVLLLEREALPGLHSTGRSAAMFMQSYGPPQARALTRASRAFYERPPAGFCDTPLLAPRGVLYVGWVGQEAALAELTSELRFTGGLVGWVDAAQALAQVPVLRSAGLLGAVTEPQAMDIDVHALHQGYLRGFRRAAGVLHCSAGLMQARRVDAHWQLTTKAGDIFECQILVNAAGAWADAVAALAGAAPLGLQAKRRSAFTFAAPPNMDTRAWPCVADVGQAWYFKPDAGQLLGSPANADPVAAHDVQPEELDIALGIHGIEGSTHLSIRRPSRTWAGLRTFAADGELVIGFDAHCPGLFWLAGQGGYGIQSAAGAAALAASLLLHQALPDELRVQGVDPAAMAPARLRG